MISASPLTSGKCFTERVKLFQYCIQFIFEIGKTSLFHVFLNQLFAEAEMLFQLFM